MEEQVAQRNNVGHYCVFIDFWVKMEVYGEVEYTTLYQALFTQAILVSWINSLMVLAFKKQKEYHQIPPLRSTTSTNSKILKRKSGCCCTFWAVIETLFHTAFLFPSAVTDCCTSWLFREVSGEFFPPWHGPNTCESVRMLCICAAYVCMSERAEKARELAESSITESSHRDVKIVL